MADKQVNVKVTPDVEMSEVEALENRIKQLQHEKIQFQIDTATQKLEATQAKIEALKNEKATLEVGVDDDKIKALDAEIGQLEGDVIDLQLTIDTNQLKQAEAEIEELDGTTIDVDVNNISAMEAVDQIGQGFDRLKSGASELGQQMGSILEAAGKQETNRTFLEMSVGADQAAQKMQEINQIVQQLPGDDTALGGLLSSAAAKNASLTATELQNMGTAAADYFAAMDYYGKSSIEAQQDMTNYILAGNTAELERSPIMQAHIDKLKEATTVQDRINALQEALNAEGWKGMSQQDTYNNKLQTFMGMIDRGKYQLGGMFQEGAKAGMDFVMQLDAASGGIVGMAIAAASFATPLTDTIMGLGQMATGIKAIKDLGFIQWLKELELMTKLSAAATWLQNTALWGMIAPILANPLTWIIVALIALAAALIWAYQNVDWFREMVDNAWASIQEFGGYILGALTGALQWLGDAFNNAGQTLQNAFTGAVEYVQGVLQGLYDYIMTLGGLIPEGVNLTGNQIIDSILAVMAFIATLPFQLQMIFINTIAQALGFGDNFTQTMIQGAINSVMGFITYISTLPSQVWMIFINVISQAMAFINNFINTLINGAFRAVSGFIQKIRDGVNQFASAIEGIKTALQNCLDWAYNMVMSHPLVQALQWLGEQAANAFAVLGLGQGSPGKIYHALENELNWSEEMVGKSSLPKATEKLGDSMSSSFSPVLDMGKTTFANGSIQQALENSGGGQEIQINLYGDVDSEERLNYFVERIRRELSWNNRTAGRGV